LGVIYDKIAAQEIDQYWQNEAELVQKAYDRVALGKNHLKIAGA
jgi:hypothetical protein